MSTNKVIIIAVLGLLALGLAFVGCHQMCCHFDGKIFSIYETVVNEKDIVENTSIEKLEEMSGLLEKEDVTLAEVGSSLEIELPGMRLFLLRIGFTSFYVPMTDRERVVTKIEEIIEQKRIVEKEKKRTGGIITN